MVFKVAIFILAGFLLYRLFMNDKIKKDENGDKEFKKKVEAGLMVRDPICGTYVEKEGSISVRNAEKVEHFCSYDCRDVYIKKIEEQSKLED